MQDGKKSLLIAAAVPHLLAEVLRRFGKVRLRVSGRSMRPAIRSGDVLVIGRCVIEDVCSGDVVLFRAGPRLVAHRVTSTHAGSRASVVITKGDALSHEDPPVSSSNVLGRVIDIRWSVRDRVRYSRLGNLYGMAARACKAASDRVRRR